MNKRNKILIIILVIITIISVVFLINNKCGNYKYNIKQIIIAENVLLNAQNKKDCVFVDYDKNGTIISACYVNSNEGHSFYASSHNIFFFDKMETGKSIKTTQASYKNTKFY